MKFIVFLGGLVLLFLLFWNSSGLEPALTSMCSDDWLIVRMKRKPFDNDTEVRARDIHLGSNCSVTKMLTFNFEFSYPVVSCGISKFMFQGNDVFILSEINYRPTSNITHKFQVVCFVKRLKLSSLAPFGMNGYGVSTLPGNSEVTKEQHPFVSSHSKNCEPSFSSSNKNQLPINSWINNACVKTFAP